MQMNGMRTPKLERCKTACSLTRHAFVQLSLAVNCTVKAYSMSKKVNLLSTLSFALRLRWIAFKYAVVKFSFSYTLTAS